MGPGYYIYPQYLRILLISRQKTPSQAPKLTKITTHTHTPNVEHGSAPHVDKHCSTRCEPQQNPGSATGYLQATVVQ